jgi:hypothetical protein
VLPEAGNALVAGPGIAAASSARRMALAAFEPPQPRQKNGGLNVGRKSMHVKYYNIINYLNKKLAEREDSNLDRALQPSNGLPQGIWGMALSAPVTSNS